jgi:cytochrome c-type biogenesis protein CcmH
MTTARRVAAAVVTAVALAVIVWGVAVGDDRPGDRVEALASELRCPVCQGESIADSAAELARDYRQLIADEVAAGSTDAEITELFVARYGDWVLLDPPARGSTLLLWALPVVALVVGMVAIATRKRPAPSDLGTEAEAVAGDAASRGTEPATADAPAPQPEDEGAAA